MAKTYVLDRVAADLARGSTHPAIQRLGSLVAAYPTDLDLRRRLAAVHRRVGNRIQAGRWDYLTIGADTDDTSAFERAFPSAAKRLREVRWPHRPTQAATAYARARLEQLFAAAEADCQTQPGATPGSRSAAGSSPRRRSGHPWWGLARLPRFLRSWNPPRPLLAVAIPVTAFLVGLGLVTVVETVIRWFVQ